MSAWRGLGTDQGDAPAATGRGGAGPGPDRRPGQDRSVMMRVVALEEHFLFPDLADRLRDRAGTMAWLNPAASAQLADLGAARLEDMDANGIDAQVLSASMPGAALLDGREGVDYAKPVNDRLAAAVSDHP